MISNTVASALTFINDAEACKQATGQTVFSAVCDDGVSRPMFHYDPDGALNAFGFNWTRFHTVLAINEAYYLGDGGGFLPIQVLLDRVMMLKDRGMFHMEDVLLIISILRMMHLGWCFNNEWLVPLLITLPNNQLEYGSVEHVIVQFFTPHDVINIDGLGLETELLNWESIMYFEPEDDVQIDPVDVRNFPWERDEDTVDTADSDSIIAVWNRTDPPELTEEELTIFIDLTLLDDEE